MLVELIYLFISFQSITMIEIEQVRISNDSSNSWIIHDNKQGFIIDCGCFWQHGIQLANRWLELFSADIPPAFIFLTHTHPDNLLGLVSFLHQLNRTKLPVYVSSSSALNEMNYWLEFWSNANPFETSLQLDKRQSPKTFPYNQHIQVLDHRITMFNDEHIEIISNFPSAESAHASMIYIRSARALFTGDLVSIHSHLFVSPLDTYPDSDTHICNWIGILQSLKCTFPPSTLIYPTHGHRPTSMSFNNIIDANLQWLIYMRGVVFNSCNATFVMKFLDDLFQNYSNFEQSRALLSNRIPQSAISVGCNCSDSLPTTCGGLQPPTCQFIPKNLTQITNSASIPIACMHKQLSSSSSSCRKTVEIISMLLTNIFFLLNMFCFVC